MSNITINGITIDPTASRVALAAVGLDNEKADKSNYILVQTRAPLTRAQRDDLAKAGAEILEAVPERTFICHYPQADLGKLRALRFVEWTEVYPDLVKIGPLLLEVPDRELAIARAALRPRPMLAVEAVLVDVILHRNAKPDVTAKKIAQAAQLAIAEVKVVGRKVRSRVGRHLLLDIAGINEVRHLEQVLPVKLSSIVARQVLRVPDPASSNSTTSYTGAGEVVAIADTGFDKGSASDVHEAFKGRVKKLYAVGRPPHHKVDKDDPHGHGTHVAGCVLANGVSKSEGPIRGTAPGAKLVLQSLLNGQGGLSLPDSLVDLLTPPYKSDGARVYVITWGCAGNGGTYDQMAYELDNFVYEDHRDLLVVCSAGNEGRDTRATGRIDPGSITPPGTAKNCLTVGASENNRATQALTYGNAWPDDFPVKPFASGRMAFDPEGVAPFSSKGPTRDQRTKPELVAPGTWIQSPRSRASQSLGWGPTKDPLYGFDGGTSMSTALVAGCAADTREFLRARHAKAKPSAALVKALLINGARRLAGQYLPSEADDAAQGFGVVNLQAVVGPYQPGEQLTFFDELKSLDAGEREDRTIQIPTSAKRLKVTLVWTDPPGEGLQSDLDLIVKSNQVERHGNMPPGSKGFDRRNNVEQVVWDGVPAGQVTVSVVAYSITKKAQNYALVVRIA